MDVSGKDVALALFDKWHAAKSEVRGVLEVASAPEDSPILEFRGKVSRISEWGVLIKGESDSSETSFEFTLRVHAWGVEFSSRSAANATRGVFAGYESAQLLVIELPGVWRCFIFAPEP